MRVLFVNHTSIVSGAEHSLLTLMGGLSPALVAGLACPEGRLADMARERGIRVHSLRGTAGSLRLHPWHTPAAVAELAVSGLQAARAAHRTGASIVHANSLRAGLAAAIACRLEPLGLVVHVRDCLPDSRSTRMIRRRVAAEADQVVAISEYVAERFRSGLSRRDVTLRVIENPVDLDRFGADLRRPGASRSREPLLAMVGQISSWKGHDTAIRALQDVRRHHPRARLVIVGEVKFAEPNTRLDNRGYLKGLRALMEELGLGQAVEFAGEREDIPQIMARADVVLVPSVEEPFGRTVAEAMAVGTPVVATTVGGPAELIEDGITGLLSPPGEPGAWSQAIGRILDDPEWALEMGRRASDVAQRRFAVERHVAAMIEVYTNVCASR